MCRGNRGKQKETASSEQYAEDKAGDKFVLREWHFIRCEVKRRKFLRRE